MHDPVLTADLDKLTDEELDRIDLQKLHDRHERKTGHESVEGLVDVLMIAVGLMA